MNFFFFFSCSSFECCQHPKNIITTSFVYALIEARPPLFFGKY